MKTGMCCRGRHKSTFQQVQQFDIDLLSGIDDWKSFPEQLESLIHAKRDCLHLTSVTVDREIRFCIQPSLIFEAPSTRLVPSFQTRLLDAV